MQAEGLINDSVESDDQNSPGQHANLAILQRRQISRTWKKSKALPPKNKPPPGQPNSSTPSSQMNLIQYFQQDCVKNDGKPVG